MPVHDVTGDAAEYQRLGLLAKQWLDQDLADNGAPVHTCGAYAEWQQGRADDRLHHLSAWEMQQWAPAPEAARLDGYTKRVLELVDATGPLAVMLVVKNSGRVARLAINPRRAVEAMSAARAAGLGSESGEVYGRIDAPEMMRLAGRLADARPIAHPTKPETVAPGREQPPPKPR